MRVTETTRQCDSFFFSKKERNFLKKERKKKIYINIFFGMVSSLQDICLSHEH
jgi:hypothetical protein